jgi:spermidine/putrescine transport system ATP-binding protein
MGYYSFKDSMRYAKTMQSPAALTYSDSDSKPIAEFLGAAKHYGDVIAADNITLSIMPGEFLSFLGPSGCGKTTALRMLAGFEVPTHGTVLLDGVPVNGLPPHKRPVNMVFQHYALFPHMNVADNISYGLRQRRPKPAAADIARRVDEALATVQMPGFGDRRIWEMSGGQQQRVALARALINQPKILLLDEPMAALDRKLRREMQIELQGLQRALGITFVLVTHDQEEALSMSDRICIMRAGRIVQIGSPRELYDAPVNRYVADFVGKSNFFDGLLSAIDGTIGTVDLQGYPGKGKLRPGYAIGTGVSLSVRPEQIALTRTATAIPVDVKNRIFLGEHTEYLVNSPTLGDFLILVSRQAETAEGGFAPGDVAFADWNPETALILAND